MIDRMGRYSACFARSAWAPFFMLFAVSSGCSDVTVRGDSADALYDSSPVRQLTPPSPDAGGLNRDASRRPDAGAINRDTPEPFDGTPPYPLDAGDTQPSDTTEAQRADNGDAGPGSVEHCSSIARSYSAALAARRRCRFDSPEQPCGSRVLVELVCPTSCTTFITDDAVVTSLSRAWADWRCDRFSWDCPAATKCTAWTSAKCVLDSAEGPLGSCRESP